MPNRQSLFYHACAMTLSNELNNATSLCDLALSLGADISCADNNRDLGETACGSILVYLSLLNTHKDLISYPFQGAWQSRATEGR